MSIDVDTPRGQQSVRDELEAVELFREHMVREHKIAVTMVRTPKACIVDYLILSGEKLIGIAEVKARNMDLDRFAHVYRAEWLVTFDKITGAVELSRVLGVPFVGVLYLTPDKIALTRTLYRPGDRPSDGWQVGFRVERTKTQKTCNGGEAVRDNAYLDMSGATMISDRFANAA